MADDRHDYEDLYRLDDLDDQEIYDLIRQELEEYPDVDPDWLEVEVIDGFVTLSGRVGTEEELQVFEHILTDVLGIEGYSNEIVVDELVRAESSPLADEAATEAAESQPALGKTDDRTDPQADHLLEDVESDLYGTQDMQRAITRGERYEPPVRPIREGSWSEENH